jgi:hypothetical protein
MTPAGNGWKLEKTLSQNSLRQLGITEIDSVLLLGATNEHTDTDYITRTSDSEAVTARNSLRGRKNFQI